MIVHKKEEIPPRYVDCLELIDSIYDISCVGGLMHIVTDDENLEDHHIEFCIGQAVEELEKFRRSGKEFYEVDDRVCTAHDTIQLGARMLEMDMDERECLLKLWRELWR